MQIVLKDQNDADVVFTHVSTAANTMEFANAGSSLMDQKRLTLSLNTNANTNRVKFKLSVPKVCASTVDCKPTVSFTQVASGDISVVRFSELDDRAELSALVASLADSAAVDTLIKNGAFPS